MSPLQPPLQNSIATLRRHLLYRGFFFLEGSASIEELHYLSQVAKDIAARKNVVRIAEIGFNAGFSSVAFLEANPNAHVVSFDIGSHLYVKSAKKYIDKKFPGRHTLIYGDSRTSLSSYKNENPDAHFDLIFIDGGHSYETAAADLANMRLFSTKDTLVIMDDLTPWTPWGIGPTQAWKEALENGSVIQKDLYKDGKQVAVVEPPGGRAWAMGHYIM